MGVGASVCPHVGVSAWRSGGTEACMPTCGRAGMEVWRSGGVYADV
jgi:hypothetical protein